MLWVDLQALQGFVADLLRVLDPRPWPLTERIQAQGACEIKVTFGVAWSISWNTVFCL